MAQDGLEIFFAHGEADVPNLSLIGNQQLDLGMMTEEAVARVDAFLESLTQCYQYDSAMMNIILEEASAYFSGQKSAEEIANLIQSRVSIYVAESR